MFLLFLAALQGSATAELVALDRRIQAAMVANETSTLRRHIAKDFHFTHIDGSVETKADVLRTASLMPRYYLRRRIVTIVTEVYGNFGLVFGSLDVASGPTPDDRPGTKAVCYALNYVHAYERRNGRWQLLSHRTTEMTQPERPCTPAG